MIYMIAYCSADNNISHPVILSVASAERRIHFVLKDKTTSQTLLDPSALPQDDEDFERAYG
jgi:hypothetical protein